MRTRSGLALPAVMALLGACGGDDTGDGSGSCTPGASAAFTITSTGVSPKAVCVLPGGSVTFTNNDAVPHDIQSGGVCTELNLGVIAPSASATAMFPVTQVCTFHDAGAPSNAAFQGTVAVTSAPATGPGY